MRWDCELRAQYERQWSERENTPPALAVFDTVQSALRAADKMMATERDDNENSSKAFKKSNSGSLDEGVMEGLVGLAAIINEGRRDSRVLVKEAPATWVGAF